MTDKTCMCDVPLDADDEGLVKRVADTLRSFDCKNADKVAAGMVRGILAHARLRAAEAITNKYIADPDDLANDHINSKKTIKGI